MLQRCAGLLPVSALRRDVPSKTAAVCSVVAALALWGGGLRLHGQETSAKPWVGSAATAVLGLPDVKHDTAGTLRLDPEALVFKGDKGGEGAINLKRMSGAWLGDERMETGGTFGRVARKVIPYGGGSALALVTQHQADLLTVESQDARGGYHAAVFLLPKGNAAGALAALTPLLVPVTVAEPRPCPEVAGVGSVLLQPIRSEGLALPGEYRALLYEQLVASLRRSDPKAVVYRVGDAEAGCALQTLTITISAFDKGNPVLRASTGPIGMFVGATSLHYNATLALRDGTVVYAHDLKSSKRGDSESLDIAHTLAQNVAKKLAKAQKQAAQKDASKQKV